VLLRELIECGLVNDDDRITVSLPFSGPVRIVKSGNWYQDHILDYQSRKIAEFSWSPKKGWKVLLEPEEVEDEK
jgi:hypothetical protein